MKDNFLFFIISCIMGITIAVNTTFNICIDESTCISAISSQCEPNNAGISCSVSLCTENVQCENGGVCISSTCYCSNNFYGTNCELSVLTDPSVNPTGLLGLSVGYPLYLTLAIPSAAVSAFIVCHLCLICCIPSMIICRRFGRRNSQKKRSGFRSSRMIENETQSDPVPNPENRHISMLHDYTEMDAVNQFNDTPPINSFPIANNASESSHTDRPLPPAPSARLPGMNRSNLPPRPTRAAVSTERESRQYSYPTVTFSNSKPNGNSNGLAIPRSTTEENGVREPGEVAGFRESGYTQVEPKYVIQNHGDSASYGANV